MSMRATVSRFPSDPNTQESSGLPWGVTVTPFASKDENGNSPVYGSGGDLIPRCENCWAYYNTYCDQEQWAWTCSLCGTLNGLSSETIARYNVPDNAPEIMSSFVDLELLRNFRILSLIVSLLYLVVMMIVKLCLEMIWLRFNLDSRL